MLKEDERDGPRLDAWDVGEAIDALEGSNAIDRDRLVRLEFALIPALGFEGEQRAKSLYGAIMSDPRLFTELICMRYKARSDSQAGEVSQTAKAGARIAWEVLYHCRRQPGSRSDGSIDGEAFVRFVDEARELCREADRLRPCDVTLGEIMAHAPAGGDGIWPFEPARQVLDRPDFHDMRHGFEVGTRNRRGMTSRAYDEGGDQERILAREIGSHAQALRTSHPNLAACLEEVARSYESEGHREDVSAKLRIEGY